jgi:tripartite-type tricarboxylate transporter receptor subunit TctC
MQTARAVVLLLAVSAVSDGTAQGYPTRPVRVIVPVTAGSAIDTVARAVGKKLAELWGQPVVVDNRTGAGGIIATGVVAKAPPDGYTLLAHSSGFAVSAKYYATLPYDPVRDLVAVAPLGTQPYVLAVSPSAGFQTAGRLIAAAKAKPGQLNFGSAGIGTGTHMVAEKFRIAAAIDVVHIAYKGGPEALSDTVSGRLTYYFPPVALALPHIQAGKLFPLGVSSARRSSLLPDVPTLAEAGLGDFEDSFWKGMWAPAGVPAELVQKIAGDTALALASADLRERLLKLGVEPMSMSPLEFARFVRDEMEATARVMQLAGIKPQ